MPRLIDADKLGELKYYLGNWSPTEWQKGWNDAIDTIMDETPTVNAVEVVRCKDCEYYSKGMPDEPTICELTMCGANDEGFCAWAERKKDAEEE